MLVTEELFNQSLEELSKAKKISIDTETTGLRPFHGDRLFMIAMHLNQKSYLFNFQDYPEEGVKGLERGLLEQFKPLFLDSERRWYGHNIKFDLHILAQEGLEIRGELWDTMAMGRVVYNDHMLYSLDQRAKDVGLEKSDAVEEYIRKYDLWEWVEIPGKKARKKDKAYRKVPFRVIAPYAERDAFVAYKLGEWQDAQLKNMAKETADKPSMPTVLECAANEVKLLRTVTRMENVGTRIDRRYCVRAAQYEADRAEKAVQEFKELTGRTFMSSPKLFAEVFAGDKDKWEYTDKGNPSFDSDTIATFTSPAAKVVQEYRDAKSKADFYTGFLYHADASDRIHPSLMQNGTVTGRFSSTEPNMQNLAAPEEDSGEPNEYEVRRAIIPSEGFRLVSIDYSAMEFRVMLELAARLMGRTTPLIDKILGGLDVHQATADLAGITRKQAKTTNFLTIYGGGNAKLAAGLGCTLDEAYRIRESIFSAAPEIKRFIQEVVRTAERRGYVFGHMGRRWHFKDRNFAYKAPNHCIQGNCADIAKVAMNRVDEFLQSYRSRLVLAVHDEFILEVAEDEMGYVPLMTKTLMVDAWDGRYLPLEASISKGHNLADLEDL